MCTIFVYPVTSLRYSFIHSLTYLLIHTDEYHVSNARADDESKLVGSRSVECVIRSVKCTPQLVLHV